MTQKTPRGVAKISRKFKSLYQSCLYFIKKATRTYNDKFQKMLIRTSCLSAEKMVPCIMELVQPKSVVDVGCGVGAWLAAFRDLGKVEDYLGFDGDYIKAQNLLIPPDHFVTKNLEEMPIACERTFDLAVSLEVGEHLTEETALPFVECLTRLAPVVLFSAAIPGQGGKNHINEQWPAYWAELFSKFQYVPVDCIRKRFWHDEEVSWWYSQNAMLYVKADRLAEYPQLSDEYHSCESVPLSLVHPTLWQKKGHCSK